MKKLLSIMLSLGLIVVMLSGCNNNGNSGELPQVSAQEVIDSVLENIKYVESLRLEAETDSSMSVMGSKVESKTKITSEIDLKEKIQYYDMQIEASGQQSAVKCYVKEHDGNSDVYMYANETWIKNTNIPSVKAVDLGLSTDSYKSMSLYLESIRNNCEITSKIIDGTECYVLSGKIDAGENEILEKVGLGNTLKQLVQSGMTSSQIDEIISNVDEFEIVVYVDKEYLLPIQMEIDITDVTQSIMDGLSKVLGETGEIKVEKNIAVSKYSKYNEIDEIVIPEEALNAQEVAMY